MQRAEINGGRVEAGSERKGILVDINRASLVPCSGQFDAEVEQGGIQRSRGRAVPVDPGLVAATA